MEYVREQFKNPIVTGVIGLVVGLVLGLVVLGWWLFPVEWTDADASKLRADLREDYIRMAIDSFALNPDVGQALKRWENLGASANEALAAVELNPGAQTSDAIAGYRAVTQAGTPPTGEAGETPAADGGGLGSLLPLLCFVVVLLGVAFGGVLYLRSRSAGAGGSGAMTSIERSAQVSREVARTDYSADPPVGQFMTTYMLGDDLFDDSFSIDSPTGEFLGECGAGISDTLERVDPKRVSAFEVWLFDKNDIQTVTKVLMSKNSFGDGEAKQRLATKGQPVLARPGEQVELETQTLRMVARVVDMTYGEGPFPPESYFDRITLELAIWPKG